MKNYIKIIHNPHNGQVSFHFREEDGKWRALSSYSPLTRPEYTNMKNLSSEALHKLIEKIDEVYNRNNRGLEIVYEGSETIFDSIRRIIRNGYQNRCIKCKWETTNIAVLGKEGVDKSDVIESLGKFMGFECKREMGRYFIRYIDEYNHVCWYVNRTDDIRKFYDSIFDKDITVLLYCIQGGRIEPYELSFLADVKEKFSHMNMNVVLTNCSMEENELKNMISEIEKAMDNKIRVIPIMGYNVKLRGVGELKPFGLK
ncbi:hypothetical protein [Selenomonas sp. AB3002]|uniref:hypothetical protein n=1 Tax=Selenomonas sp. AB3002 TaxID=1392502 RepID=UPI000497140E